MTIHVGEPIDAKRPKPDNAVTPSWRALDSINFMPYFENSEEEWIHSLSDEAERDVIFLWHITGAKFGGPTYSKEELPMAIERITNALIVTGSTVGFGDPDKAD